MNRGRFVPFRGRGRYIRPGYAPRGAFSAYNMRPGGASFVGERTFETSAHLYLGIRITEFSKFRDSNKFPKFSKEEILEERSRCEQIDACLAEEGRISCQKLLESIQHAYKERAAFTDLQELEEFVKLRSNLFDSEEEEAEDGQGTLFISNQPYTDRIGWTRLAHHIGYFTFVNEDEFEESSKTSYSAILGLMYGLYHSLELNNPIEYVEAKSYEKRALLDAFTILPPFRQYLSNNKELSIERVRRLPYKQGRLFEIFEDHVELTDEALSVPSLWYQSAQPRLQSLPSIDRSLAVTRLVYIPPNTANLSTIGIVTDLTSEMLPTSQERTIEVMIDSRTVIFNGRIRGFQPIEETRYVCLMAPVTGAAFNYYAIEIMDLDYAAKTDPSKRDPKYWTPFPLTVQPSDLQRLETEIEELRSFATVLLHAPADNLVESLQLTAKALYMESPFTDLLDVRRFLVRFLKNLRDVLASNKSNLSLQSQIKTLRNLIGNEQFEAKLNQFLADERGSKFVTQFNEIC